MSTGNIPQVVSFYTKGSAYEAEIFGMEKSAKKFGIEPCVECLDGVGTWEGNIRLKAGFILRMAERFGRVLWLDSDARFLRYPKELIGIPHDIDLMYYEVDWSDHEGPREGRELNAGVLYASGSYDCLGFLREWAKRCNEKGPEDTYWDQWILADLIAEESTHWRPDLKMTRFDRDLAIISETLEDVTDPLFMFRQASRWLKETINKTEAKA